MTAAPPAPSNLPAPPSPGWLASLRLAAADIKLAHSVFALPFAILGAFLATPALLTPTARELATPGFDPSWRTFLFQLALIVACMVLARTWAMLVNRLADREFDKDNARTARRLVASGALPATRARAIALACATAFVACTSLFLILFGNPWPLILSIPVLGFIALYSYTKRFTLLCHAFLGAALAISPLAAAIAIRPDALTTTPALWYLSAFVLLWVAGFDVLYAIQDIAFDRENSLRSVPARLGLSGALHTSRALHALAFLALAYATHVEERFDLATHAAVALVALLLVAEHVVVARRGVAGIPMAFFTINGVVSCLLGATGAIDLLTERL